MMECPICGGSGYGGACVTCGGKGTMTAAEDPDCWLDFWADAMLAAEEPELAPAPSAADADKKGRGAADPVIDAAIDRLGTREVTPSDRGKLRGALDKADAPLGGIDRANEALRGISRRQ